MPYATVNIRQPGAARRVEKISGGASSLGRHTSNDIVLVYDREVAPYHARIAERDGAFWLTNLVGPSTTRINDEEVELERQLCDGDLIRLGGATLIEFHYTGGDAASEGVSPGASEGSSGRATAGGWRWPYVVLVGVVSLALVGGAVLVLTHLTAGQCRGTARIVSPQPGSAVRQPLDIILDYTEPQCIERVSYQLNGVEFAHAETPPYAARLDPAEFRNLSGGIQVLTVTVENRGGETQRQPDEVLLAFAAGAGPVATPTVAPPVQPTPEPPPPGATNITIADVQSMSRTLAGQLSDRSDYVFDAKFADLIRARANDYRRSGYTKRARQYHWDLKAAFRAYGLPPLLGYVLAMSRSQFYERATPEGTTLWQVPLPVARVYLSPGEDVAALSSPKRSTEVAAVYMKDLSNKFEDGDFMYAVACFGSTIDEAGRLRSELDARVPDHAERRDFWKMVKSGVVKPEAGARIVSFFAAGIVVENPALFGLQDEKVFADL